MDEEKITIGCTVYVPWAYDRINILKCNAENIDYEKECVEVITLAGNKSWMNIRAMIHPQNHMAKRYIL